MLGLLKKYLVFAALNGMLLDPTYMLPRNEPNNAANIWLNISTQVRSVYKETIIKALLTE